MRILLAVLVDSVGEITVEVERVDRTKVGLLTESTPEFIPATIWDGLGGGVGFTTVGGGVELGTRIGRVAALDSPARTPAQTRPRRIRLGLLGDGCQEWQMVPMGLVEVPRS
jgi:hypothetical protein